MSALLTVLFSVFSSPSLALDDLEFVDATEDVPSSLMNEIGDLLPESNNAGAAFLTDAYDGTLIMAADSTLTVTFLWEGAGFENTLGYMIYRKSSSGRYRVDNRHLIFPNVSFAPDGALETGMVATLRDEEGEPRVFEAGEKVGFFLISDGAHTNQVKNWSPYIKLPKTNPAKNLKFGEGLYTSIADLNPEVSQGYADLSDHMAIVQMQHEDFNESERFFLMSFEDLNRTESSDEDFNDAVFILRSESPDDIDAAGIFQYASGDPDGDGAEAANDQMPWDADRALRTRYPTHGSYSVAFEDNYPEIGDADYNDALVAYHYEYVTDSEGNLKDIVLTAHLIARGAAYDAQLELALPGLDAGHGGLAQVEYYLSGDAIIPVVEDPVSINDITNGDGLSLTMLPSTIDALPPLEGEVFTNTTASEMEREAAAARVVITFDTPLTPEQARDIQPDIVLSVVHDDGLYDIHIPGRDSYSDRPSWLPSESGPGAYLDGNGMPWAMELPTDWRFPVEYIHVQWGYPQFMDWVASSGLENPDWYQATADDDTLYSERLEEYLPTHDWLLDIPR